MRFFERNEKYVLLATFFIFIVPIYFITNNLSPFFDPHTLHTWVDGEVAFGLPWQYIYTTVYIFSLLPVFIIHDRLLFRRVIGAFATMMLSSYVIFLLYPVQITRPTGFNDRTFIGWTLQLTYYLDRPMNCFPSLHLGQAFLAAFITYYVDRTIGIFALIVATLIGVSTLKVKQHYFLDTVAGVFLAIVMFQIWIGSYKPENKESMTKKYSRHHLMYFILAIALYFGVGFILYRLNFRPWEKDLPWFINF